MGTASSSDPDRATKAADAALVSLLLEGIDLSGACGVYIVFSNALFPLQGTSRTARDGCESVFGDGQDSLRVDSAAESSLSWLSFVSCPRAPGRFHRSCIPSDALGSSSTCDCVA